MRRQSGVGALYAPRRTVLDPIILDAAERAGAEVVEGATADGLVRDVGGRVTGVVGHHDDGRPLHVDARVVVGADGWRSRVARDAGAPAYDEREATNAIHYAYWSGLDDRGVELWYRSAGGVMAGVFPTNGGACVWVNCRADADRAAARFHAARDRTRPLYELGWAMASYRWDTSSLLDLHAAFAAELVREAQDVRALPTWPG